MRTRFSLLIILIAGLVLAAALSIGSQMKANAALPHPGKLFTISDPSSLSSTTMQMPPDSDSAASGAYSGTTVNEHTASTGPTGQMSYQGRLLQNGRAFSGVINITFSLYTELTGGLAVWTETQSVNIESGLFSVMLGSNNRLPSYLFYYQMYLGIQPVGAAELTPRQPLGTSAYAMGLVPGVTMVDTTPPGGYIYAFSVIANQRSGIDARADANGAYGVNGSATGNDSAGIAAFNSGDTTGCNLANNNYCASSVYGSTNSDAYGLMAFATTRSALIIKDTSTSFWNIYDYNTNSSTDGGILTTGPLSVNGYATFYGGKSGYVVDIAINAGSEPLERGDVVVIIGADYPVVGEIPVARVVKATPENASGIMGVVDVLYNTCDRPADSLQAGEKCGGFDPSVTRIQPGQYLSVVTLGAYGYLKADTTGGSIKAGDLLTISSNTGLAAKASMITVQGVSFYAPGTLIGKALGDLDTGSGIIPVFVTIQ